MERCDYKSLKHDRYKSTTREHPSFSSTLLDSIYRSIDDNNGETTEQELILYRESLIMRKNQINNNANNSLKEDDLANLKRASLIEKSISEKVVVVRRKSMADFHRNSNSMMLNSSNSTSDSSGLSSSEAESIHGVNSRSSNFNHIRKPKPIRTSVLSSDKARNEYHSNSNSHEQSYQESNNNFWKTKSRALKIYSDLKNPKQPISPGGRLASFLNALFTPGNSKKTKISTQYDDANSGKTKSKSAHTSTCSSASRSCLSKTPSSSEGKVINGGEKRSVRFYPGSVMVDEDCRPRMAVENDEYARDVVKYYHKNNGDFAMKDVTEASNDDAMSCASSDLFELDNIGSTGIDRYSEELPVFETTHYGLNRAIAKGLLV